MRIIAKKRQLIIVLGIRKEYINKQKGEKRRHHREKIPQKHHNMKYVINVVPKIIFSNGPFALDDIFFCNDF
jgi:hypothetical protein